MKKITKLLGIALLACAMVFIGCESEPSGPNLNGTWKFAAGDYFIIDGSSSSSSLLIHFSGGMEAKGTLTYTETTLTSTITETRANSSAPWGNDTGGGTVNYTRNGNTITIKDAPGDLSWMNGDWIKQ